jgi:hypothetical protein
MLNNEKWIVKDGWLANSGPMTLRLDKDTADAVVKDNMTRVQQLTGCAIWKLAVHRQKLI